MQLHSSAHAAPRAPRAARQQQASRQHACKIVCRASATSASSTTFGQQTPLTPEQVQKRQKQLQDLVQESVKIGLETGAWFFAVQLLLAVAKQLNQSLDVDTIPWTLPAVG